MRISIPFAGIVIFTLMLAFGAFAPSGAATIAPRLKADATARVAMEVSHRRRAVRLYVPIAPNYSAYDYPYYFARGYYPTHIGPGYIYYGRPYAYYGSPYATYRHRGHLKRGAYRARY